MVYLCVQTIKGLLCLVVFVLSNIKRQKEGEEFFDEKIFISKNCSNKYLARNLLPDKRFSKPARKSPSCYHLAHPRRDGPHKG